MADPKTQQPQKPASQPSPPLQIRGTPTDSAVAQFVAEARSAKGNAIVIYSESVRADCIFETNQKATVTIKQNREVTISLEPEGEPVVVEG